ncbi:WAT1-related protein At2g39510-like [Carya illinoinensis]|uniref:WAT1-related protein At2g39510-like n=1 Tax=Carya illinoinensis TaxID=32201 RepID=UPI001C71B5C8|nr:WAT1-related protein At2g39510-like [Carya illinoinensis]
MFPRPLIEKFTFHIGRSGEWVAIIAKFALNQGMSHYVMVAYRMAIATVVTGLDVSLYRPVLDQCLHYIGMTYTNSSFPSSMYNILPAVAFLMASMFGLERVNIRELHSQAKILGTIVVVGGAMSMTLIQGSELNLP